MTYPTYRYHANLPARVIYGPDQEEAGWEDSPAKHGFETAPGKIPDPAIAAIAAQRILGRPSDEANSEKPTEPMEPPEASGPNNKRRR